MILFDPEAMMAPLAARAASLQASGAPGVVVEVSRGGRTASIATGVEDIHTDQPAVTRQTFEVGSHTKMTTAVILLQLAEEGRIDLDAPAANWLPAATIAGIPNAATATVRQMLEMRSGIPAYPDALDVSGTPLYIKWIEEHPGQVFGPEQALEIARGLPASNPPGGAFHYSNTAYLLLGLLIEAVTGEAWAGVVDERIFDAAGMTHSSAHTLDIDARRWSSYADRDGELVDVTRDLWQPRGESGIVSTTSDLIAFLEALLVDKTLLSPSALAQMTDYQNLFSSSNNQFGLGIFRQRGGDGNRVEGFAGGTLGTSSATYYDAAYGIFVSLAANVSGANASGEAKTLDAVVRGLDAWAAFDDHGDPLEIRSVSAARLGVGETDYGGVHLASGGASIDLVRGLRAMDAATTVFEDGSVLVVGDGTTDTGADDLGNIVRIAQMFPDALEQDNQILGLGGDDQLVGGRGNDRIVGGFGSDRLVGGRGNDKLIGGAGSEQIVGGRGDDRMFGGRGDEKLAGGAGHDRLVGGPGSDRLIGGAGADRLTGNGSKDVFVFREGESAAAAPDTIADLHGNDRIGLRQIDAVEGGGNSRFHWVGTEAFSGTAGELRYEQIAAGLHVEGDTNGDGHADLAIILEGLDTLGSDQFVL